MGPQLSGEGVLAPGSGALAHGGVVAEGTKEKGCLNEVKMRKACQSLDSRPWVAAFSHHPLTSLPEANSLLTLRQVQVEVRDNAGRSLERFIGNYGGLACGVSVPRESPERWMAFRCSLSAQGLLGEPTSAAPKASPWPEPLVPLDQTSPTRECGLARVGAGWAGCAGGRTRVARLQQMNWLIEVLVFI